MSRKGKIMGAKQALALHAKWASAEGFAVSVLVGGDWLEISNVEIDGDNPGLLIGSIDTGAIYIDMGAVQAVRSDNRA